MVAQPRERRHPIYEERQQLAVVCPGPARRYAIKTMRAA
jgi:hypothetical protein